MKAPADNYLSWLAAEGGLKWWHDSANPRELGQALASGACGVTTNPVLAYQALQAAPGSGDLIREAEAGPQAPGRAELVLQSIIPGLARILQPVYERTGHENGYVCAQVDPRLANDAGRMLEMARRFAAWAPNIAVKLPVTKEGLAVLEECIAEGITAVGTVSFTVSQVLAVAERHRRGSGRAREKGRKPGRCFAVLMVGRLDDYLLELARGTDLDEGAIRYAGVATVKRAYSCFGQRGYETSLLVAALRGSYHVENITGGRIVLSIHPKYQASLVADQVPRVPDRIHEPVKAEIIDRLMSLPEFREAYEIDGLKEEQFVSYGASQRTLAQFIQEGWQRLASSGLKK